jgi:hypothetical protein
MVPRALQPAEILLLPARRGDGILIHARRRRCRSAERRGLNSLHRRGQAMTPRINRDRLSAGSRPSTASARCPAAAIAGSRTTCATGCRPNLGVCTRHYPKPRGRVRKERRRGQLNAIREFSAWGHPLSCLKGNRAIPPADGYVRHMLSRVR